MKAFDDYIEFLKTKDYAQASLLIEAIYAIYKKEENMQKEASYIKGLINASFALEQKRNKKYNAHAIMWARYVKAKELRTSLKTENHIFYEECEKLLEELNEKSL